VPDLSWVIEAFNDLSTCRPTTQFGIARIPWTAINEYASARDVDDVARFEYLIREMDRALLETLHERGWDDA